MTAIDRGAADTERDDQRLKQMIGLDGHRPGTARARLIAEQIPVWAIIGYMDAVAGTIEPPATTDDVIAQTAIDYGISHEAIRAALLYYEEHRAAIDTLLEANAAALA